MFSTLSATRLATIALFTALAAFFLAWLGHYPLLDPDEGRYGEIAREMLANHNWITPTLNGLPFLHKPILYYWLSAASMALGGVNEFALRLVPAFCGLIGCCCVFITGKLLFNRRVGFLAAAMLATSPLYFGAAHYSNMDMLVAVLISACLCSFLIASVLPHTHKMQNVSEWACWIFAALGILAKGLIAVAIPGMIALIWIMSQQKWQRLRQIYWLRGGVVFLLITVPWFYYAEKATPGFLHYFFIEQQFTRYLSANFNNNNPWWFYLPIVLFGFMPWTLFLLAGSNALLKRSTNGVEWFLALWIVVVLVFFSLPSAKLVGYILPVFPPLALLTARFIDNNLWSRLCLFKGLLAFIILFSTLSICAVWLAWFSIVKLRYEYPSFAIILYSLSLLTLISSGLLIVLWRKQTAQLAVLIVSMTLFLLVIVAHSNEFAPQSTKKMATIILQRARATDKIVNYNAYYFSLPFYLQKNVLVVADWHNQKELAEDNWKEQLGFGLRYSHAYASNLIDETTLFSLWKQKVRLWIIGKPQEHGLEKLPNQYLFYRDERGQLISNVQPIRLNMLSAP